jgi:hypothetical protein
MSRLFWRFNGDAATLSSGSVDADFPLSNILNDLLAKAYKTGTSSADEWVVFDLGSAQSIDAVALLGHTFINGTDTLEIEGNAADSWGAPSFSEALTIVDGGPLVHYFAGGDETFRYWRVKITKGAAGTQHTIGRILLGQSYTLAQEVTQGMVSWGWKDTSESSTTRGGQKYTDAGVRLRTLSVSIDHMPQTQADEIQALIETYGTGTAWLFSLVETIEPSDWAMYGTLEPVPTAMADRNWTDTAATWSITFSLTEQG